MNQSRIRQKVMATFASNAPAPGAVNGAMIGKGLVLREVREDSKPVVIGIDFGTAYSGVAFALKKLPGEVFYGAPGTTDPIQTKVPTVLLQLPDDQWEFGYQAESLYDAMLSAINKDVGESPKGSLFKSFKMELKKKERGLEALSAKCVLGKNSCRLMTLVVKSLEFLMACALSLAAKPYGREISAKNDVQWVLTVPAIWNDFGKAFMRTAAFKAGMMETEQSDTLMLVLEPEGAALAVHVGASQHNLLGVGSRFMVLDCGGGTIDITVHDVETLSPLSMSAILAPAGGDWGGETVNAEFKKFLAEFLGEEICNNPSLLPEMFKIYAAFEQIKVMYEPNKIPTNLRVGDVLNANRDLVSLVAEWNKIHPEKPVVHTSLTVSGMLTLSAKLMMSFFEPSLKATVDECRGLMDKEPGIRHIMVVGGYGSSKVLISRIRDEFHEKAGVQVIMPDANPKPQGAIVHGAVYFGLYKDIMVSRVSPYTYGVAMRIDGVEDVFARLVAVGEKLPYDHLTSLNGYPRDEDQKTITWLVYRSDKPDPKTVLGEHLLGPGVEVNCPADPDGDRSKRKQTGKFYFGGSEIRVFIEDLHGNITPSKISMV